MLQCGEAVMEGFCLKFNDGFRVTLDVDIGWLSSSAIPRGWISVFAQRGYHIEDVEMKTWR
ncbi:MAG: hypothetical protein LBR80_04100 [Deltaproteobacteria bacterium]|nr:hypothetical protein [Deltaproteobacteria bacterium]